LAGSRTKNAIPAAVATVKMPSATIAGRQPNASAAAASGAAPITLPAVPNAIVQDASTARRAGE
jgi:hypothetical protein